VAEHANVAAPAAAAVSVAAPKPPTAVAPPAGPVDGASSSTSGAGDDKSTSAAPAAPESGDGGSSTSMAWDSDATTVTGITKPSQELKLTFYGQGLIASRPVKEGDFVHKGQVLMTEDAEVEQLEYDSMKVESGSHLPIDYAVADYNSKCIVRDRLQAAANDQVANESELQEAIANAEEARIKIDLSKEELRQKSLETDKQGAKVAKMQMVAPIDGIVEKLNLDIGEMVDPNKPEGVVVLVKNDPIWVEVHLPSVEAARLKLGDEFDLKYEGEDQWLPEKGRVNFLDPVVDAASDTRLVRLEVRNPSNRPAGLHVAVRLPEHLAAAN
jgi:RND family efflux transporter MFP subunit